MTFVILRHNLASIIGRMVHHFQQVRTPSHYSDVLALDDELMKFVKNLPPHFALEPDTSFDNTSSYIPIHRFLLITEILFVRISLHRPYLLRRLESDRYLRSRTACFESAITDFKARQDFRLSMPQETQESLSNAYREFQTAMISGIYLVLEPNGKDAPAMHAILDAFMTEHEGLQDTDETTRRELKTIEFLKAKSLQVEGRGSVQRANHAMEINSAPLSNEDGQPAEAQVLLSLQHGSRQPNVPSPSRLAFASLATALNPHQSPTQTAHSSRFHRRQQSNDSYLPSPVGSGSPCVEDESTAQSLLDHWCNVVSHGPLDTLNGIAATNLGNVADNDLHMWPMNGPCADSSLLRGLDGSDWNYWETLVNQIPVRGTPLHG